MNPSCDGLDLTQRTLGARFDFAYRRSVAKSAYGA
jgi:hypothetical protein